MALNAYLAVKGQKQGVIQGSVTQKGREGTILVHAYSHEVESQQDPQSRAPTGKRTHQPFVITKEVDRSSPLLWMAMITGENLASFDLKFWTASPASATGLSVEKQMYTITLSNANIAYIKEYMTDNDDPESVKLPLREEISFTYQKIQWTWVDGGITSGDNWT